MNAASTAHREPFRYWAFVSYSHHDRRVARLIVKKLAKRTVPRIFRSTVSDSPATFSSLYLDEQETSVGSVLSGELQTALHSSRKLIVVCSPFAVGSKYVSREIEYFQSIGRSHDILCVIASGVPNASESGRDELECFPHPLRFASDDEGKQISVPEAERPLAAALADESDRDWQNVIEQLEGGLLGLARSEVARLKRSRLLSRLLVVVGVVTTVAAIVGGLLWSFILPHHAYAAEVTRTWGIPGPVFSFSRRESGRRPASWRFERKGAFGRIVRITLVNQEGRCPISAFDDPRVPRIRSATGDTIDIECSTIQPCGYTLTYKPDGSILSETLVDQFGNPIETLAYSASTPKLAIITEASVGCSRTPTQVEFLEIERYASGVLAGRDRKVAFKGGTEKVPRANRSFAFGRAFAYDGMGLVSEETWLDDSGRPHNSRDGFASVIYLRDVSGEVVERQHLDEIGRSSIPTKGSAYILSEPIERGYGETIRFLDDARRQTTNEGGVFGLRYRRNEQGQVTSLETIDETGSIADDGNGIAVRHVSYDAFGFPSEFTAFNSDGRPVMTESIFSANGRDDDKGVGGCFKVSIKYTKYGESRSVKCFGESGQPTLTLAGWHEYIAEHTKTGNVASETFWGVNGEPVVRVDLENADYRSTVHRSIVEWDDFGREVRRRFYRADKTYAINGQGLSGWDYEYDAQGHIAMATFIGTEGDKSASPQHGCVVLRKIHDEVGNNTRTECLDSRAKLSPGKDGVSIVNGKYDRFGRLVGVRFYNTAGKPTTDSNGVYGVSSEYDNRGRVSKRFLRNESGGLMANSDGWIGWRYHYDRAGRWVGIDRLREEGSRIALRECAKTRYDLDQFGRTVVERCLDAKDTPANWPDKQHASIHLTLDSRGNQIRHRYLDMRGRPAMDEVGAHGYSYSFDDRGRVVRLVARNPDWSPVETSEGWAFREFDFNALDLPIEERFFDLRGKPTRDTWVPIIRRQYDSLGRERIRAFFDVNRKPMLHPVSGRAMVHYEYDDMGRLIHESSLGVNGEPINFKGKGWHRVTYSRSPNGGKETQQCFAVGGSVIEPCHTD